VSRPRSRGASLSAKQRRWHSAGYWLDATTVVYQTINSDQLYEIQNVILQIHKVTVEALW
jgi:hypothetical protein